MSSVPVSHGGSEDGVSPGDTSRQRSARPAPAAGTRFAAPDPSGPGAAKLLENLRRLGFRTEHAAPASRRRTR